MTRDPEINVQLPTGSAANHRAVASALAAPSTVAVLLTVPIGALIANMLGLDRAGSEGV